MTNRDQAILKLQSEIDTTQQQYTGIIEELQIRDNEVQRLNNKVKELQSDIRDLHSQLEISEEKVCTFGF